MPCLISARYLLSEIRDHLKVVERNGVFEQNEPLSRETVEIYENHRIRTHTRFL